MSIYTSLQRHSPPPVHQLNKGSLLRKCSSHVRCKWTAPRRHAGLYTYCLQLHFNPFCSVRPTLDPVTNYSLKIEVPFIQLLLCIHWYWKHDCVVWYVNFYCYIWAYSNTCNFVNIYDFDQSESASVCVTAPLSTWKLHQCFSSVVDFSFLQGNLMSTPLLESLFQYSKDNLLYIN